MCVLFFQRSLRISQLEAHQCIFHLKSSYFLVTSRATIIQKYSQKFFIITVSILFCSLSHLKVMYCWVAVIASFSHLRIVYNWWIYLQKNPLDLRVLLSKIKPNKIWVNKVSDFYNRSMKTWLKDLFLLKGLLELWRIENNNK